MHKKNQSVDGANNTKVPLPLVKKHNDQLEVTDAEIVEWRAAAEVRHRQWLAGLRERND